MDADTIDDSLWLLEDFMHLDKRTLSAFEQCSVNYPKDLLEPHVWKKLFETCGKKTLHNILIGTLHFYKMELDKEYTEKLTTWTTAKEAQKNIEAENEREREIKWAEIRARKEAIKEAYREEANNEITILKKKAAKLDSLIRLAQDVA